MAQVSLGKLEVLKKDGISLKDVDPENIPEGLDVIIEPREKEVILIGRRMNLVNSEEGGSNSPYIHQLQTNQFHEKSYQEFMDKETYFFDLSFTFLSWTNWLRMMVRGAILTSFALCVSLSFNEIIRAMDNSILLEEQELSALEKQKTQLLVSSRLRLASTAPTTNFD